MRAKVLAESEVKTKSEKGDGEGNKWIVQMLFNTPLQQLLQNICNHVWSTQTWACCFISIHVPDMSTDLNAVLRDNGSARLAFLHLSSALPLF